MRNTAKTTPMFSICIPLYNTEKYISHCIDSVLGQTYTNFEIIIIDDGSTDHSSAIADSYVSKDERVRVFHQKNQGVFHTRIQAFKKAEGEYMICLDADDYLEKNALMVIDNEVKKQGADLVIYNNYVLYENHHRDIAEPLFLTKKIWESEKVDLLELYATTTKVSALWRKAIKKELIDNEKLTDMPRITMGDDWILSFYPLMNAKKIVYVPEALITYRIVSTSLTAKYDTQLYKTLGIIYDLKESISRNEGEKILSPKILKREYMAALAKIIAYVPGKVKDKREYMEMLSNIKEDRYIQEIYKQSKLKYIYKIPFWLLYGKHYQALYIIKLFFSIIRKRT